MVREMLCGCLRDVNYHVLEADDGPAAMELLKDSSHAIDLLITDVVLPSISGPQLALKLRKQQAALPVLLMSGYADRADGHPPVPGAEFLEKPITLPRFLRSVRAVLDKRPGLDL